MLPILREILTMAGPYKYYSTAGSIVSITSPINFSMREGPMSFCKAVTIADQHGCKYREDASRGDHCMYWRKHYEGACDCIWAQRGIVKPKSEEDDEVEQAMAIIPT